MTRRLSLSALVPVTGTRIPNGPHGDVDERFSAEIQHALKAQATGDEAASGNKPPSRVPVAKESNTTATKNKTNTANENKTTRSDQQPTGTGKVSRFGLFGQGAINLGIDTTPRNDFRPPNPNAQQDGFAAVRLRAGAFRDITSRVRMTADATVLTKLPL